MICEDNRHLFRKGEYVCLCGKMRRKVMTIIAPADLRGVRL